MNSKVAVVTGGGTGLGLATAQELVRRNYQVYVFDREAASVPHEGIELLPCDVTREESVQEAFAKVGGALSLLVNNAGSYQERRWLELTLDEWRSAIEVNLTAAFLCARRAVPAMVNGGVIINVTSNLAAIPEPMALPYCAAKAGLNMLTRCLAVDLAPRIRVLGVAPGPLDMKGMGHDCDKAAAAYQRFNPLGRFGTVAEVASLIGYLSSNEAAYMTGTIVSVDGGESAVPTAWSILSRVRDTGGVV